MGIYSEVLKKRAKNDSYLEEIADQNLLSGSNLGAEKDFMDNARDCISYILKSFNLESNIVSDCNDIESLLDSVLDPEGIMYEKINLKENNWKENGGFVIAFYENIPVVLKPGFLGHMCYLPNKRASILLKKNMKFMDDAYLIYRPMERGKFSIIKFLKLMLHLVLPKDIPMIASATFMISVLGLVTPKLNKYVLGTLIKKSSGVYRELISLAFIFIAAGILKSLISIIKNFWLGKIKLRISTQMQSAIIAKVLLMPYDYFLNSSVGKQSVQIQVAKNLSELIINFVMNNLLDVIFAIVYIPQMKSLASNLVIPALLILVIQIFLSIFLCLGASKNTRELLFFRQNSNSLLYEIFKGIQKVKGIGAEKRVYAMIADRYRKVLAATLEPPILVRLNTVILSIVSSFSTLFILILAAKQKVSSADYVAFTASYSLISSSVDSLVSMSKSVITIRPLLDQMRQLFNYKIVTRDGEKYVSSLKGSITVENLNFSYDKNQKNCLENINFHVRRGEKVAFVGTSGCGKSTLLKLMLGLLSPDSGSILFDGMPILSFNKRSFRKNIASVFQFSSVFPGTIFENIVFTANNADETDVWQAAEYASIAEDIKRLPLGMDTQISEGNGGGFSGGQKQRILLARAFAQKPSVMILDEATSALDNKTQKNVLDAVYKMDCTVIMVAHRLSTVKNCDRIIMFQKGKIVEQGNYQELINKNGAFAELVRKQQTENF